MKHRRAFWCTERNALFRAVTAIWISGVFLSHAFALSPALQQEPQQQHERFQILESQYRSQMLPLVRQFCLECHSTEASEGELDLERFHSITEVRQDTAVWQKVVEMLDNGEMPPRDAAQPGTPQRALLRDWVQSLLQAEALARAGDPGPVPLRRLSNAEYRYTIQDLTQVALDPTREFPQDGAAGEGFTNTGYSSGMSPALVSRYLDAAKEVASHAVLLPDGIRFSKWQTRNDRVNDTLDRIRSFYSQFTDSRGGDRVNLQGVIFDTNHGGRLPLELYLKATLAERDALHSNQRTIVEVAADRGLSPTYLGALWSVLTKQEGNDSQLLQQLRDRWRLAQPDEAAELESWVALWQQALWRFTTVGHIGKVNGPSAWMEAMSPLVVEQEFRRPLSTLDSSGRDVVFYLAAGDAGDGNEHDFVVWERPRLVVPGRPELMLRDVRSVTQQLMQQRARMIEEAERSLAAAAEFIRSDSGTDIRRLAEQHRVNYGHLAAWLHVLGAGVTESVNPGERISRPLESAAGYNFIRGWTGDDALSVIANSSDQHVRVPGNMKPHSVAVHPAPTVSVGIGWKSPVKTLLQIEGSIQHAHPECGNGIEWAVELRRGMIRQRLASGTSQGAAIVTFGPLQQLSVRTGDVVVLVVSPRDGNHSCDLTAVDLILTDGDRRWNLAEQISPDILAGNPQADACSNADVWHFFSESVQGTAGHVIPAGSLLAAWCSAETTSEQQLLGQQIGHLLQTGAVDLPTDAPDRLLYQQLTSLSGPLQSAAWQQTVTLLDGPAEQGQPGSPGAGDDPPAEQFGPDPALFGRHPVAGSVDENSLCFQAPQVIEIRLPADLAAGAEFVTTARLHSETAREGSVQVELLKSRPVAVEGLRPTSIARSTGSGSWTSVSPRTEHLTPVIVSQQSEARSRMESTFDQFRQLFPAALCYTKIVPVDEVVTLTLFYREDDHLQRLMLDDAQKASLDRLWDELHYISQDALTTVDAFMQLMEYATQDADPGVFEPLRKPIQERAERFSQRLIETEPLHVQAVLEFAERAFRRPLKESEASRLHEMYQDLRRQQLSHADAINAVLARVLVSPAFLYRMEQPVAGVAASAVNDWELASRLSYFLWSSAPDAELRVLAASGQLRDPDVLTGQSLRMLRDLKVRRLSTEFACQWLQIYDLDQLDEKSERHFPTFLSVRESLYEEAVLFFTDLFQRDGSILELFDADHVFVNQSLARHYGIPDAAGDAWQRRDNSRRYGRGGILTLGAILAKQSGASRTSPILRGTWLSEVVLGEKLPKPPKGVPPLPDDAVTEELTVRQLVERHTSDARCSGCHRRIDPYGFALEAYDAIGRLRTEELAGKLIDTSTTVMDGTSIDGVDDLRRYLVENRRDAVLRQFCRKLLGYSLGRAVQLSDEPLLTEMQLRLSQNQYRISEAVASIVQSRQFREIRGRDGPQEDFAENP